MSLQACISRKTGSWSAELCKTQIDEDSSGKSTVSCLCKTVDPVTVVEDLKGLLSDSKVDEVFSSEGISALLSVEFYRMYMFYILIFKTFGFLYCIKVAWRLESEQARIHDQVIGS